MEDEKDQTKQKRNTSTAKLARAGISPKKVWALASSLIGLPVGDAKVLLNFSKQKASDLIFKVIRSAEANGVTNHGLKESNLVIKEIRIGSGPTRKSGRPGAKGVFKPMRKRSSNIEVVLEEVSSE